MRKKLLLFVAGGLFILLGSAFAQAQCPEDSNDLGVCDTMWLETFCDDAALLSPGVETQVRVPIYVTHDLNTQPNGEPDSIAAFVIPLCYTSSNAAANAQIPDTSNTTHLWPWPTLWGCVFRHLECQGVTTTNWMMAKAELMGPEWDTRVLNLVGEGAQTQVFWLCLFATGLEDQRFGAEDHVLLVTITFHVQDSTTICLDSCFWPPNSRLSFTRADATSYVPRTNLPYRVSIFHRAVGDCNADGTIDVSDAVYLINYLFRDGPAPPLQVGDVNCDGVILAGDVVFLLNYLFRGGPAPCEG